MRSGGIDCVIDVARGLWRMLFPMMLSVGPVMETVGVTSVEGVRGRAPARPGTNSHTRP